MPRRAMALVRTRFEDWLPEPLTVATRIVKSLTARAGMEWNYSPFRRVGPSTLRTGMPAGNKKRTPMLGSRSRRPPRRLLQRDRSQRRSDTTIAVRVRLTDRIGRTGGRPNLSRRARRRGRGGRRVRQRIRHLRARRRCAEIPLLRVGLSLLHRGPRSQRQREAQRCAGAAASETGAALGHGAAIVSLRAADVRALRQELGRVQQTGSAAARPQIVVENDQDAYYAWFYSDAAEPAPARQQLALRLRTPTHQYHYVRIPIPFPIPWGGWPQQHPVQRHARDGRLARRRPDRIRCSARSSGEPRQANRYALLADTRIAQQSTVKAIHFAGG